MVAAVYIQRFASNQPGRIMCQECRSDPNVIDANQAAGRCLGFCFVEQGIELWNSRSGSRRQRSRGDGMDANARVESKRVHKFANMSDEELRQYVYGKKE